MSDINSEILDADFKKSGKTFAEKSFRMFVINLAIILFGVVLLNGGMGIFSMAFLFIPAVIGFVQAIKSFRNKEDSSWKKYVGFFGNLILLLLPILFISALIIMD